MNRLPYPPAPIFPPVQPGTMNMYMDIMAFFASVVQEFSTRGSVRFEKQKVVFIQQANEIVRTANALGYQVFLPMRVARSSTWDRPLSVVESEKLREVVFYISRCIAEVIGIHMFSTIVLGPFDFYRHHSSEHGIILQRYTEQFS